MTQLSRPGALIVLVALMALLVFGTQMPGAWRDEVLRVAHLPGQLTTNVAHFVLFAALSCVARLPPLSLGLGWLAAWALALALLTEGLQYLAANRDPSWADVGLDLAGAAMGMWVAKGLAVHFKK